MFKLELNSHDNDNSSSAADSVKKLNENIVEERKFKKVKNSSSNNASPPSSSGTGDDNEKEKSVDLFATTRTSVRVCRNRLNHFGNNFKKRTFSLEEHSSLGTKVTGLKNFQKLSSGGFGSVYTGVDKDKCKYALKVITSQHDTSSFLRNVFLPQFGREIASLKALKSHENIVQIIESYLLFNETIGIIKMEYLNGGCLRDYCKEAVSLPIVSRIAQQIGSAISYMHQKGFVHHDIKLENIGVQKYASKVQPTCAEILENATFKLLDFGLVRRYVPSKKTENSFSGGTINYISPEKLIVSRKQTYDPYKADAYAFGVSLLIARFGLNTFRKEYNYIESMRLKSNDLKKFYNFFTHKVLPLNMNHFAHYLYEMFSTDENPIESLSIADHAILSLLKDEISRNSTKMGRITVDEALIEFARYDICRHVDGGRKWYK